MAFGRECHPWVAKESWPAAEKREEGPSLLKYIQFIVKAITAFIARALLVLIRLYQAILSPLLGSHCRFSPTCSQYIAETLRSRPLFLALVLSFKRIARCHPFSDGGPDPVPKNING